jgi:serine/threonine protein kinase
MSLRPSHFLGRLLPRLKNALAELDSFPSPAEEEGRVELYWPKTAAEHILVNPETVLATTIPEAVLPEDHPPVEVPGVLLERYLGGGGQGWVFAGRVIDTGHVVAVKVLRADPEGGENRAAREALLGSRVRHRNVLRVFRAEPVGRYWLLVMELIQGRDLESVALGRNEFRACLLQIVEALRELARQRIVHCDVKPANILLRSHDRTPVLVDFGVAWDLDSPRTHRSLFGTPYFLPPEAFALPGRPDPSWDAYGLGVTAAVVLLGRTFPWKTLPELESAKHSGAFEANLREQLETVRDAGLRDWITILLDHEPARRMGAMEDAGWFLIP